ncbi:hypothetical protein ACLB1T_18835 [Escherichia coli]
MAAWKRRHYWLKVAKLPVRVVSGKMLPLAHRPGKDNYYAIFLRVAYDKKGNASKRVQRQRWSLPEQV